jgi:hypothetical protein
MKVERISPTTLMLYRSCPYCFYLKQEGIPQTSSPQMQFGIAVHNALKEYHVDKIMPEEHLLNRYVELYSQLWSDNYQECEKRLAVPLFDTGIVLSFQIDLIADNWIVEHKTTSRDYSQKFMDEHFQATAYSYGFRQYYDMIEEGIRFNIFNTVNQSFATYNTFRTEEDLRQFEQEVKDLLTGIEANYFEPKEAQYHLFKECPNHKDHEKSAYR